MRTDGAHTSRAARVVDHRPSAETSKTSTNEPHRFRVSTLTLIYDYFVDDCSGAAPFVDVLVVRAAPLVRSARVPTPRARSSPPSRNDVLPHLSAYRCASA